MNDSFSPRLAKIQRIRIFNLYYWPSTVSVQGVSSKMLLKLNVWWFYYIGHKYVLMLIFAKMIKQWHWEFPSSQGMYGLVETPDTRTTPPPPLPWNKYQGSCSSYLEPSTREWWRCVLARTPENGWLYIGTN